VTLVESRRKKCTFLSQVVRTLGLANCTVLERDARKPGDRACAFAAVVARAFLPAEELIDVGKAFLKPNGRIVIMGARRERELETLGSRHPELVRVDDRRFQLPGGRERRRIVVFASRA
jgi:16S rRNA G527 N7-methylase RsmG